MALDCVFRLPHSLHHTDGRQNFLCKRNQQTTEQTEDALRSLRRVVGLHGHTELHNAPAYIEKQLTYAGHPNAIFSEDAMKAVHSFSSGIPRLINRACTQSLVYAYQNRRAIIDDRMVQLVLEGEVS